MSGLGLYPERRNQRNQEGFGLCFTIPPFTSSSSRWIYRTDLLVTYSRLSNMAMKMTVILLLSALVLLQLGFAAPSALLWSPHRRIESSVVNYQTVSPKDVAESLVSNLKLSRDQSEGDLDLALVFLGKQLLHSASFSNDNDLVNSIKASFTSSNFSMAFPYIGSSGEETLPLALLSGFTAFTNVAFSGSCSVPTPNLPSLDSIDDYLAKGESDVIVFCHEDSDELHQSEGEAFSKLVSSMERSGKRYAVLYASDSYNPIQYPSRMEIDRFLAETTNASKGCGEVCKIKSSLLEGLLVAIVLLMILISGICCMMGIDTPTRFETPQDS